jgi:hypothetical protein
MHKRMGIKLNQEMDGCKYCTIVESTLQAK